MHSKNKIMLILAGLIFLITSISVSGYFYYKNISSTVPAVNLLTMPPGFQISVFEDKLDHARVMAFDYRGNLWVSQMDSGKVVMIDIEDEKSQGVYEFPALTNLNKPHGLAFDPEDPGRLYIAQEDKIVYVDVYAKNIINFPVDYADTPDYKLVYMSLTASPIIYPKDIIELPTGGRHLSRTIGFGPDGRLYVSIGSSCDVCHEEDLRRGSIYSMYTDGTDFKQAAQGLRNAVFFVFKDNKIWVTEMGRDQLGDNLPPDEINVIDITNVEIENFGWPLCYGKNVLDTNFDKLDYGVNPCREPVYMGTKVDLQAHSVPLGLAFVPREAAWGEEYYNNLLVAFHGSSDITVPTGYKVVRLIFDEYQNFIRQEDFIDGWIKEGQVSGRPVDMIFGPDNALYISDDKAHMIYRVTHQ